ncbi:MAG: ferrochelatase, partial [Pseudomonadota bacterium]
TPSDTLPPMRPLHGGADHPPVRLGKVGVLLVNLGTPDAPETGAVRRYLREFLSDTRVVDYPRLLWLPLLYGIILNTRPAKTAKLYKSIWREESNESPLRYYTRAQAEGVCEAADPELVGHLEIDWAMRYGEPSLEQKIDALQSKGCDRLLILPLYPQYSGSTTATVVDEVGRILKQKAWQPSIRVAPPFYDEDGYIDALEASMRKHVTGNVDRVILSFHGIPQRYFRQGDPYHCHCQKTARLLRERMGWDDHFAPLAFQSKFGPEKWLEPSTEDLVEAAAEEGIKHLAIAAPAFVSDCIETLEEVDMGLHETFLEGGGKEFTAIPCLNDDTDFIQYLAQLVGRELSGWVASTHETHSHSVSA